MVTSPTYLYGLTAAVYVTTCLVVAAVRWFHMCRPYNRNPQYYYPGRPFLTGVWLSSLTLLPYVLNPESPDAWFVARFYFLPVTLYHFTLILFSYFGNVMQWKQWRWPEIIAGVPVVLILLAAVVLAIVPGTQIGGTRLASYVLYILGLLITAVCISTIAMVYVWASRFDPDDYSNPSDFPVARARKWLAMMIPNLVLCWVGALLDNQGVLAVIMLIIAAFCVVTVITSLHPNRNHPVEEIEAASGVSVEGAPEGVHQGYIRSLSQHRQAEIMAAIVTVVEEQQAFLDPHLTLQDVADRCGYSRTYIAGLVKGELGGFNAYVNRLRLAYVDDYQKRHPDAPLREAIKAAGFGSRSRYYDAKARFQAL